MSDPDRHILVPVGSEGTFTNPIGYLDRIYPDKSLLKATLLHVCSRLPAEFVSDPEIDAETRRNMVLWQQMAESEARSLLNRARVSLAETGIAQQQIHTIQTGRDVGTVRDICRWAAGHPIDAVLVARRGRTELDPFFMKGITGRLAENCTGRPLWIISGDIRNQRVLVFFDSGTNGRRAADHVARMLAGTGAGITLLHVSRSLRRLVPPEFFSRVPAAEKIWSSNSPRYIEPELDAARRLILSGGFSESQVDTRIVDGSANLADQITRQIRRHTYGTVVLCRHAVPSIREFLQGIDLAYGREPHEGLAVWIV